MSLNYRRTHNTQHWPIKSVLFVPPKVLLRKKFENKTEGHGLTQNKAINDKQTLKPMRRGSSYMTTKHSSDDCHCIIWPYFPKIINGQSSSTSIVQKLQMNRNNYT